MRRGRAKYDRRVERERGGRGTSGGARCVVMDSRCMVMLVRPCGVAQGSHASHSTQHNTKTTTQRSPSLFKELNKSSRLFPLPSIPPPAPTSHPTDNKQPLSLTSSPLYPLLTLSNATHSNTPPQHPFYLHLPIHRNTQTTTTDSSSPSPSPPPPPLSSGISSRGEFSLRGNVRDLVRGEGVSSHLSFYNSLITSQSISIM